MRLSILLLIALGLLAHHAAAQPSLSGTAASTGSNTGSLSVSTSPTASTTSSPIPPPAVTNIQNKCVNHTTSICPSWVPPPGFFFASFVVTAVGGGKTVSITVPGTAVSARIGSLSASITYAVTIQGIQFFGPPEVAATASFSTIAASPKADATKDIRNFNCTAVRDSRNRVALNCTWTAPTVAPLRIGAKCHCVSTIREPVLIRKHLFKAKALATSILFRVHRDVTTCVASIRAYYARPVTAIKEGLFGRRRTVLIVLPKI